MITPSKGLNFLGCIRAFTLLLPLFTIQPALAEYVWCGDCHGMPDEYRNKCVWIGAIHIETRYVPNSTFCSPPTFPGTWLGCQPAPQYLFHRANKTIPDATIVKSGTRNNGAINITVYAVADTTSEFNNFKSAVIAGWQKTVSACELNISISINITRQLITNGSTNVYYQEKTIAPPSSANPPPEFCGTRLSKSGHDIIRINNTATCNKSTTIKHEFGHLIGFGDAYALPFPAAGHNDTTDIMAWGSQVKGYHARALWEWN